MNALYSRMRGYVDISTSYVSIAQSFRMANIINSHSADTFLLLSSFPPSPLSILSTLTRSNHGIGGRTGSGFREGDRISLPEDLKDALRSDVPPTA